MDDRSTKNLIDPWTKDYLNDQLTELGGTQRRVGRSIEEMLLEVYALPLPDGATRDAFIQKLRDTAASHTMSVASTSRLGAVLETVTAPPPRPEAPEQRKSMLERVQTTLEQLSERVTAEIALLPDPASPTSSVPTIPVNTPPGRVLH